MSVLDRDVRSSVRAFLEAHFPELALRKEDDKTWREWAGQVGYRPTAAKELVRTGGVGLTFLARAVLVRIIPVDYLPFPWRNKPLDSYSDMAGYEHEPVPEVMHRLRYEALCWFMEDVLPRSTQFDSSNHPLTTEIPRLNRIVATYLCREHPADEWFDPRRVFECYHLTALVPEYGREYHSGLFILLSSSVAEQWKECAEAKIRKMIKQELEGDPNFAGSLASYIRTYGNWHNSPDEGPPPYEGGLVKRQEDFLKGLDAPLEEHIPPDVIAASSGLWRDGDFVARLAQRFLVEEFPRAKPSVETGWCRGKLNMRRVRQGIYPQPPRVSWLGLVSLAREVLEIPGLDTKVSAAATRVLKLDSLQHEKASRRSKAAERDQERRKEALRQIMAKMK